MKRGEEREGKMLESGRKRESGRRVEEDGRNTPPQKKKKLPGGFCIYHERLTFRGVFLASGNSLSSSRSQRWRNCCTMGFSGLIIWNPLMLAPPRATLSRLTLEKPCRSNKRATMTVAEEELFALSLSNPTWPYYHATSSMQRIRYGTPCTSINISNLCVRGRHKNSSPYLHQL